MRVSAAAVPMGYSRSDSSTKRRRIAAVHTSPSSVPASATKSISTQLTSSARPSIQMPGMVKARPPATMEPADITICVTVASLRLRRPKARSRKQRDDGGEDGWPRQRAHLEGGVDRRGRDDDAANAPDGNAHGAQLPAPRGARALLAHMCSFVYPLPPRRGVGLRHGLIQYIENARERQTSFGGSHGKRSQEERARR